MKHDDPPIADEEQVKAILEAYARNYFKVHAGPTNTLTLKQAVASVETLIAAAFKRGEEQGRREERREMSGTLSRYIDINDPGNVGNVKKALAALGTGEGDSK